jgi:inner membrane protein
LDTLTHAVSGALLARATAPRADGRRIAAGFLACAAPDADYLFSYAGPVEYILNHRGITHSLLLLPLWALLLAWLLATLLREPRGWKALYGICAAALLAHIVADVITNFGTMVFAPLSDWRAAIGTTFIIDLWFSGIILAGLAASAFVPKSRIPAIAACAVLVGYVGFQYIQKQRALAFGHAHAAGQGLANARVVAQPRPVSPFNWTVFVSDEDAHRFAHVNLRRSERREYRLEDGLIAKLDAQYLPLSQSVWVTRTRYGETREAKEIARDAWQSPALGFFRWFADLPAFDGLTEGSTCVWFTDLRFYIPGRDAVPFRYGACRGAPGAAWKAYERAGPGRILLR